MKAADRPEGKAPNS